MSTWRSRSTAHMIRLVVETGDDFGRSVGDEAYFAAMVDLFRERFGPDVEITKFASRPSLVLAQ